MRFSIQASRPRTTAKHDAEDSTLDEAIQTAFPLHTEAAFLCWDNCFIPLSYKYDISLMILDIIGMLESIIEQPSGPLHIDWASNTFAATWDIDWGRENVRIRSEWHSVVGENRPQDLAPTMELSRHDFISEWRELLLRAAEGLSECAYGSSTIAELTRLQALLERMPRSGVLYR